MTIPDPLTPIAITGSIVGNIATDILKHYAVHLEGSLAGRILKHTGLLQKNFIDKFGEMLGESLAILFDRFPNYRVTGVIEFIKDPKFAEQLLSFLLDRKNIDDETVQKIFAKNISSDPYTVIILKQRGIDAELIVQAFFVCYREALLKHIDLPQIFVLLEIFKQTEIIVEEIRTSEDRLKEYVSDLFKDYFTPSQKQNAHSWEGFLRSCEQKLDLEIKSSIGKKFIPSLYVHREIESQYDEFVGKSAWGRETIVNRLGTNIDEIKREEGAINQLIGNIDTELKEMLDDQRILNAFLSERIDGSPDELWRKLNSVIIYLEPVDRDIKVAFDTLGDELNIIDSEFSQQSDKTLLYKERLDGIRQQLLELSKDLSKRLRKQEVLESLDNAIRNKQSQLIALKKRLLETGKIKGSLKETKNILTTISGQKAYNDIETHLLLIEEIFIKQRNLVNNLGFITNTLALIRRHFRNCFLVVDRAGSGKTNLLCHLAKKYAKSQAVIFVSGRTLVDNEFSIEDYVVKSVRCPEIELDFDNLGDVNDFLAGCRNESVNSQLLIFIDGINENSNGTILKRAIQRILSTSLDRDVLFCISCRDIFWDFFSDEFWDEFVFEFAKDRLYNFTQKEFSIALERYLSYYQIDCHMQGEALDKCHQPLLLRFFCEAYGNPNENIVHLGDVKEIRLKKLFDDYWIRKISNARTSLGYRTGRDVELFLYTISDFMWKNHTRSIPLSNLKTITNLSDLNSDKSVYIRILDEDIIIEEGSSSQVEPWVTFVYDEFMEYSIAKEIINNLPETAPDSEIEETIEVLLENYQKFTNIEGVVAYLCIMFISERQRPIWDILINKGKPWTLVVAKSINQLSLDEITHTEFEIIQKLSTLDDEVKAEVLISAKRIDEISSFNVISIWANLFSSPLTRLPAKDRLVYYANKGREQALNVFLNAINHSSAELRTISIYSLTEIRKITPEIIADRVNDHNVLVRQAVAYALQFFPNEFNYFLSLLDDKDPDIRRQACLSLSGCNDISMGLKLSDVFLNDIDSQVQEAARTSIQYISSNSSKSEQALLLEEYMRIEELLELELQDIQLNGLLDSYDAFYEDSVSDNSEPNPNDDVLYLSTPVDDYWVEGKDEDVEFELMDYIEDDTEYDEIEIEIANIRVLHDQLMVALESLNDQEKLVLEYRFGFTDGRAHTQEETGKLLSLPRVRINQIETQAIIKLRHPARSRELRDYLV